MCVSPSQSGLVNSVALTFGWIQGSFNAAVWGNEISLISVTVSLTNAFSSPLRRATLLFMQRDRSAASPRILRHIKQVFFIAFLLLKLSAFLRGEVWGTTSFPFLTNKIAEIRRRLTGLELPPREISRSSRPACARLWVAPKTCSFVGS